MRVHHLIESIPTYNYISSLLAMYADMDKLVYDRVDRFKDEHSLCPNLETNGTEVEKVWVVSCPWHNAVVVFEER